MVHADDHAPVLDGLPEGAAQGQATGEEAGSSPDHFWDEGGDPNDLEVQRWGVIAPIGPAGDRLLALIRPLVALREEQQGAPVRVYRVPPEMTQDEAMRWKKREFDNGADFNIDVPRYQLLLGDLDQMPLALQQVQASDGYVGRLAFSKEDDYAAYAEKVLRWDRRSRAAGRGGKSLFFTVHDGTAATTVGHRALIGPGVEIARKRHVAGQYPAREIVEFGDSFTPSPDELLSRTAAVEPSVLFTLSHGEGAPRGGWRSPDEQRSRQGAMSFGREGRIASDDLRARAFLPGGVWFMLACYGAGTPAVSAYRHWLASLAGAGQYRGKVDAVLAGLPGPRDRPFIAAIPQAVLANPEGPLAFMGHIDLAWTYSFQELDSGATNRPARFMAITRSLLKRDRAGVSLRELIRFFDQTNVELTALLDQEAQAKAAGQPYTPDLGRQGHLWMLRQDLAAYVLLGDPACRLPDADEAIAASPPAPVEVSSARARPVEPSAQVAAPAPAPTPAPAPAPAPARAREPLGFAQPAEAPVLSASELDALEEAIARRVAAELHLQSVAGRLGLGGDALARMLADYRAGGREALQRP